MTNYDPKVHIPHNVKDINKSVEFYQKMFDAKPMKHFADYAKFDLASSSLNLVLNQTDFIQGGSLSHLDVQVFSTDAVMATREN